MLKSMTGFGRGEVNGEKQKLTLEMRAVNHRFCEVGVRMPRAFMQLEDKMRRKVKAFIARGKVDIYVNVEKTVDTDCTVKVDKGLAIAYYRAIKELQSETQTDGEIGIEHLINMPGIMEFQEDEIDAGELWLLIEQALDASLEQLISMRENEGAELAEDLLERSAKILELADHVQKRAPLVVEEYRRKLQARLEDLLGNGIVDQDRIVAETAFFADKSDITEELVRLRSHVVQVESCLRGASPVGRKLDFLSQEMLREINTIGSKATDAEISKMVVELKSELEKIREQVQNIE